MFEIRCEVEDVSWEAPDVTLRNIERSELDSNRVNIWQCSTTDNHCAKNTEIVIFT